MSNYSIMLTLVITNIVGIAWAWVLSKKSKDDSISEFFSGAATLLWVLGILWTLGVHADLYRKTLILKTIHVLPYCLGIFVNTCLTIFTIYELNKFKNIIRGFKHFLRAIGKTSGQE